LFFRNGGDSDQEEWSDSEIDKLVIVTQRFGGQGHSQQSYPGHNRMTADMAQTISEGLRQYEQQLYSRRRTEQELQAKLPPGSLGRQNFYEPNLSRSLNFNGMYPLPPAPYNTPNVTSAQFPVRPDG